MLKRNLFFLFSVTFVAITSVALCLYNYNPYSAKAYQFAIFFASLFAALAGILSLIIFYAKILILKKETIYSLFWPSVRQAIILSIAATLLLFLNSLNLLDIWIGAPLSVAILLMELFFQTKRKVSNA